MRRTLLALTSLVPLLLGACGTSGQEAFDKQYDESFMASCTSSASDSGIAPDIATKACQCALYGINAKYSGTEKVTLSQEQAAPIVNECKAKVMPTNG